MAKSDVTIFVGDGVPDIKVIDRRGNTIHPSKVGRITAGFGSSVIGSGGTAKVLDVDSRVNVKEKLEGIFVGSEVTHGVDGFHVD